MVRVQNYTFSIVVIQAYFVCAKGGGKHTHTDTDTHVELQVAM